MDEVTPYAAFGSRLKDAIEQSALKNQSELANKLSLSRGAISQWIKGEINPAKIGSEASMRAELLLGVRWKYLVTGEGTPEVDFADHPEEPIATRPPAPAPTLDPTEFCVVKFHPYTRASMGKGGFINDDRSAPQELGLVFRRYSLQRRGIDPDSCCVIFGEGRSMAPTINPGDAIMFDTALTRLVEGDIYVFDTPHGITVKRFGYDAEGRPSLISDNKDPEFRPKPMTAGIDVVGRVMWHSGWL